MFTPYVVQRVRLHRGGWGWGGIRDSRTAGAPFFTLRPLVPGWTQCRALESGVAWCVWSAVGELGARSWEGPSQPPGGRQGLFGKV
jgi:hypothetical protein